MSLPTPGLAGRDSYQPQLPMPRTQGCRVIWRREGDPTYYLDEGFGPWAETLDSTYMVFLNPDKTNYLDIAPCYSDSFGNNRTWFAPVSTTTNRPCGSKVNPQGTTRGSSSSGLDSTLPPGPAITEMVPSGLSL